MLGKASLMEKTFIKLSSDKVPGFNLPKLNALDCQEILHDIVILVGRQKSISRSRDFDRFMALSIERQLERQSHED